MSSPISYTQRAEEKGVLAAKRARLARLIQERLHSATDGFDLSEGQKAIWYLSRTSKNPAVFNTFFAARIEGELDWACLNDAAALLMQRHPSLRTVFVEEGGELRQRVLSDCPLQVQNIDVTTLDSTMLAQHVSAAYQRLFDLECGPLVRLELFRGATDRILLLTLHHLIYDGWSLWLLIDELLIAYRELEHGRSPALPVLVAGYRDFVEWQHSFIRSSEGQAQLDYWMGQLHADDPPLQMPVDFSRPKLPSHLGGSVLIDLGSSLAAKLASFGKAHDATLYATLLSAYFALLRRYGDEDAITVGALAAGSKRQSSDFSGVVGYFVNPLAIRCEITTDQTFVAVLAVVKDQVLDALEHQDYPFSKIVEKLKSKRDTSRNPIFQTLFAVQRPQVAMDLGAFFVGAAKGATITAGACKLRPASISVGESRFDLAVDVVVTGDTVMANFLYSDDLFRRESVEQIARHFAGLLEACIDSPDRPIWSLPLLSVAERRALLELRNATAFDLPDVCLADLFEAAATRYADKPAVRFGTQTLTYGELNRRAEQVANDLAFRGATANSLIGIAVARSLEMLVGLLAVAKLKAAYVPIDPSYPSDRIQWMLDDAMVSFMLTQSHLASRWRDVGCPSILLDQPETLSGGSVERPSALRGDGTAYVIYTSGSTGKPKGVQVSHRNVANFLLTMRDGLGLGAEDVLLAVTTLSFDIAVLELYLPLIVGGTVVIADASITTDGQALCAEMARRSPTWMQATPATWQMLLAADWGGSPGMSILCGGEALPSTLAAHLLPRCRALWNVYGPTETTVWSVAHKVTSADVEDAASVVPIGRPIGNTVVYILDDHRQLVADGVAGELYIGGLGVSQGYRGREDLTAERFVRVPDVYQDGLLYRTGDLARWRRDGLLEFLGRADQQLKVRGFRIEPGEIESVLLEDPEVREAVVVCREDQPGDHRLVAYVAQRMAERFDTATATGDMFNSPNFDKRRDVLASRLKSTLKARLPEYLCPSVIEVLRLLPKTPNGKVNRAALPAPQAQRNARPASRAPLAENERRVAAIWCEVLGLTSVGIDDNFFDLGGHSFLAARARVLFEREFGDDARDLSLFEFPTVRALVNRLSGTVSGPADAVPSPDADDGFRERNARGAREDIAIIGLACRVPGASDADAFWELLAQGREGIRFFSKAELDAAGVPASLQNQPGFVPAAALLEGADLFDAEFFGYAAREAAMTDPQHRVMLECAWHALENAGYANSAQPRAAGVFVGAAMNRYFAYNVVPNVDVSQPVGGYQVMIGNDKDYLATRVSYKLNLVGPGLTVQTACSTSLVAVHQACQSLRLDECELALAGGVAIQLPQQPGYLYQEGMILSPDGHCRAFDADARGTVVGSGVGVVVLKRLHDALRDGDTIRAVIRGSAINNDGFGKIGYTAPSTAGQAEVIGRALSQAGLRADEITYVETHGTGTELGDPIEIAGLTKAFAKDTKSTGFCAIGSVKTNVGHLDAAAGVTGLIKTVLALEHREIPPSLHFTRPNPKTALASSPFFVNDRLRRWESEVPRRAGVSSFGIGGTNAHVVLEEAPQTAVVISPSEWLPRLLCISARTPAALRMLSAAYARRMRRLTPAELSALCFTAQTGARHWNYRLVVPAVDAETCAHLLQEYAESGSSDGEGLVRSGEIGEFSPVVEFICEAELGDEILALARAVKNLDAFRIAIDACDLALRQLGGESVRAALDDEGRSSSGSSSFARAHQFAVQYGLAKLWQSWGIVSAKVYGVGWGEYAAACIAGLFSVEEGIRLVFDQERKRVDGAGRFLPLSEIRREQQLAAVLCLGWADLPNAPQPTEAGYWRDFDPTLALRSRVKSGDHGAIALFLGCLPRDARRPEWKSTPHDTWREHLVQIWTDLYLAGAPLDWAEFYRGVPCRRMPLPGYPFQRQRYWLEQPNSSNVPVRAEPAAPVMDAEVVSVPHPRSVPPDMPTNGERAETWAYRDHVVHGNPIAPGTLMLRWIIEAGSRALGADVVTIRDLLWSAPLVMSGVDSVRAQVTVSELLAGRVEVEIRTTHPLDPTRTTLHALAVVMRGEPRPEVMGAATLDALRQRFPQTESAVQELYRRCRRMGIEYGPAFRVVRTLGFGTQEALGLIRLEAANLTGRSAVDRWALVLDGCLQLAGVSLPEDALSRTVMPMALDAFVAWTDIPDAVWGHLSLVSDSGHDGLAYIANVEIFDLNGVKVAQLIGLHLKGLPLPAVPERDERWHDWLYRAQWQQQECPEQISLAFDALAAIGRVELEKQSVASFKAYREVLRAINRLAAQYAAHALHALGLHPEQTRYPDGDGRRIGELVATQRRLMPTLERMARDAGTVPSAQALMQSHEALAQRFPFARHELTLLRRCGERLVDVLIGEVDPLDVLFPGADLEVTARFYSEAVPTVSINAAIAAIVREASSTRKLRVLEIGGGSGSTSAAILERAAGDEVDYCFTDVSVVFLKQAQRRHGARRNFRCQRLDISQNPEQQGFEAGFFDVIVAVNVLHATSELETTLRHVRSLLKPGGVILLAEATPGQDWVELVFGITDGWWLFADTSVRGHSPLVDVPTWSRLLETSGLQWVDALPRDPATLGQSLLIARRPVSDTVAPIESKMTSRRWIVLGDGDGLGSTLVRRLVSEGDDAVLVTSVDTDRVAANHDVPFTPEDKVAALRARVEHVLNRLGGVDCVVNLLPLEVGGAEASSTANLETRLAEAMSATLAVIQAFAYAELRQPPRMLLVTRAAVAAVETDRVEGLWQTPFIGLAKILRREHPEFASRCIDLDARNDTFDIEMLLRESRVTDEEESVAYRGGVRFVPRLVRCDAPAPGATPVLRSDRCYLITGGTGGLGMKVAQWMVERGARTLVLVSRQGQVAEGDEAVLAALTTRGVRVRVLAADMASEQAVRQALAEVKVMGLPLGGIVHAAGVLDDGVLLRQTWQRFRHVLAPKLLGAWHLHRLTQDEPLDFFVLFSSIASVFGFMAQGSHTSASAFLDGLSWYRTQQGQPALALNWGPWRDIGAAAARSGLRGNRIEWIDPMDWQPAMEAFTWSVQQASAQIGIFSVDWDHPAAPRERQASMQMRELAAPVVPVASLVGSTAVPAVVSAVAAPVSASVVVKQSGADRNAALGAVRDVVASIMGVASQDVDVSRGLFESGLDSLAAVELRQKLQSRFAISLPATLVFRFPTVVAIAAHIDELVAARPADVSASPMVMKPAETDRSVALGVVRDVVASIMGVASQDVDVSRGLFESGLDSLAAVELRQKLQSRFAISLPATLVFRFPTVVAIAAHIDELVAARPADVSASPMVMKPAETDRSVALGVVRDVVASIMGVASQDVDVSRGLFESGLDSLAAVELRQKLQSRFAISLPATLVFRFPTVAAIAAHIDELIAARPADASASPIMAVKAPREPDGSPDREALETLSEDELALILGNELNSLNSRGAR